jgi:hypothetical protein
MLYFKNKQDVEKFRNLNKSRCPITTAYHEAGHAVASIVCRLKFKYITNIPDSDKLGCLEFCPINLPKLYEGNMRLLVGRVVGRMFGANDGSDRRLEARLYRQKIRVKRDIVRMYAGSVSEQNHLYYKHNIARPWTEPEEGFVRMQEGKYHIIPLHDDELIKQTKEVFGFSKDVYREAIGIVMGYWAKIEAIANALINERRMKYFRVREVFFQSVAHPVAQVEELKEKIKG